MEEDLKAPSIAVVVPAYQVPATIQQVLTGIPDLVDMIIVVDDGNQDDSAKKVKEANDKRVQLISHPENRGVGAAVLTGYAAACAQGADVIVKMDGDGQMDPAYILSLVLPVVSGEADYAKGNRFVDGRELRRMPLRRRVGNVGLSLMTKAATGYWHMFDPTNGYTAIHRSILPLLNKEALDPRYFFETSMLIELGRLGAVVWDVPIPARYGGERSHLSEFEALLRFPLRLAKAAAGRVVRQHVIQDFGAFAMLLLFGCLLALFGSVYGAYEWYLSATTGKAATAGTVMLAVLPLVLGAQFLLQSFLTDIQAVPSVPLQRRIAAEQELEERLRQRTKRTRQSRSK